MDGSLDIGYLDSDDYLYLTDRKQTQSFRGRNIYPQEIENHLFGHPAVSDVAVIVLQTMNLGKARPSLFPFKSL